MLMSNQKKIDQKKIRNKLGGDANESRFGGDTRELRKRKVMIVGSVNTKGYVKLDQAWNEEARKKDVVRLRIGDKSIIVERSELEQALGYFAQGDEIIKYTPPSIVKNL